MANYYIAVDENGDAYIAHGAKLSSSMDRQEGSKYYAKEEVKPGIWRYYYSAQEWLAAHNPKAAASNLYNNARTGVTNAYNNVRTGAANAYNNARAGVTNAYNNVRTGANNIYNNARTGIENFGRQAREDINNSPGMRAVQGVKNAINTAADKLGFDERKRAKEAWGQVGGNIDTSNPNSKKAWEQAEKAQEEYRNTPLGKAEYTAGRIKEAVGDAKYDIKDKYERMREEFRNRNSSQLSEYTENDPDFDDKNYTEDRRVGDTDFFIFKGKDGRTVILEEDAKWTLPKGIRPDSPEIRSVLEKAYDLPGESCEEWERNVNDALNEAIKASKRK